MTTEIAKKEETQVSKKKVTVQSLLASDTIKSRIDQVLGKNAAQFASTLIALSNDQNLKDCSPASIVGSGMVAATMNLPINQNLGFAYLVPYNDKKKGKVAQFQMGYKGFIQLAQRTGQYKTMNDVIIPAGVLKNFNPLTGEIDLDWDAETDGLPDGYVFFFELVNGFQKTIFWSRDKVERHAKQYSFQFRKYKSGLWNDEFDKQALKTVIKHGLSRYGIMSVDMQRAFSDDQAVVDEHGNLDYIDNPDEELDVTNSMVDVANEEEDQEPVTELPQA